jgi:hypothetical protein
LLFRLPMTSQAGCYDAANGSLALDTPQRKSTMQYALDGATLTLVAQMANPTPFGEPIPGTRATSLTIGRPAPARVSRVAHTAG